MQSGNGLQRDLYQPSWAGFVSLEDQALIHVECDLAVRRDVGPDQRGEASAVVNGE